MKKGKKIVLVVLGCLLLIVGTAIITTLFVSARWQALWDARCPEEKKAEEVAAYLDAYFIDNYDDGELADAAAAAMVEATGDRWSFYLNADEAEDYYNSMSNVYAGIGVTITENAEKGGMEIMEVVPGGPADQAGVLVGDIVIEVEGQKTIDLGMDGTRNLVAGTIGTEVQMVFLRGEETIPMTLKRAAIETVVAECEMLEDDIGYITVANFDERCADETIACIEQMVAGGAKGLIFDVRFNPGGYEEELTKLLDYLLPEGEIFHTLDYAGEEERKYSDENCLKLPMAVLVNEDSYSAAEFFAAALQEYDWADVVGETTCGKGNFQVAMDLSDGSVMNISVGKYFTPQGKSLTDVGVTPDLPVEVTDEEYYQLYYDQLDKAGDTQLNAAIDAVRQKIS